MLCASLGHGECLKILLSNNTLNINAVEQSTGTNAFWMAAYYGRGECISLLANHGIDILNVSNTT